MFGTVLLVLFFIASVVFTIIMIFFHKQFMAFLERKKPPEDNNVYSEYRLFHLNGHPYLETNEKILFQICKNHTIRISKNKKTIDEIPFVNILKYEVKTESEIRRDVTLTRLLALGIFAFGVKKETKIEERYLIFNYTKNNVIIECLFKELSPLEKVGNITSEINRLRLEGER